MAHREQQLQDFMDQISDDPDASFNMLLYCGDLDEAFASDEDWGSLCEFAMKIEEERDESISFMTRYKQAMEKGGFDGMLSAILSDMHDNHIVAAMGLHRFGVAKNMRFIPAAAYNKHCFVGVKGEFAVVRFLHWSGFDINAVEADTGMSALHYFASLKYQPGTHNRAVEWLLDHGADPNAQNSQGDSPFAYLCGQVDWGKAHTVSALALIKAGANPLLEAEDGSTPLSLMKQNNEAEPREGRTALIAMLEDIYAELRASMEEQASDEDDSEERQAEGEEPTTEGDTDSEDEQAVATTPEPAKPVQAAEVVQQAPQQAEQKNHQTEPAKTVAAMAPIDFDALMKLQGVAWGNDGKPMKVSLGDK